MTTLTENDRKLAETLKSLSIEPLTAQQKPRRKTLPWIFGVAITAAVGLGVALVSTGHWVDLQSPLDLERLFGEFEPAAATPMSQTQKVSDTLVDNPSPARIAAREITGSGFVIAPRSTSVFSKYEGAIHSLNVEVGDQVEAGQVLAIIDAPEAQFALEKAKLQKTSADLALKAREIALVQAIATYNRNKILAQRSAISRSAFEQAETNWKSAINLEQQARQDVLSAELAVEIAQEQVDELTIRAPFAGTVTQINARVSDTILARVDSVRESQNLLVLVDTSSLVIDASVAEKAISPLQPGATGEAMLDAFPDQPFEITLQRIAPIVSADRGTINLRLSISAPPEGIRPNMAARIRLLISPQNAQLEP
ncbi:Macrolide export protein MacA [Pseudovibrio sp. W64]|uniref:efflux RND transporter periplasmic adaptor subunit n=1 Tax=Pseudovibrio TaxID=258255 RepID=UPI0007AEC8BE|nr:efflux RND transporter periplasmic adaptor subunit [Pseudovibrio sp. W64]KZK87652.1 Macrolide export protein MacA [Pseudovibrio sp. W64]